MLTLLATNKDNLTLSEISFIFRWAIYFGDLDFAMDIIENTGDVYQCWFPIMKNVRQVPRFKDFVREIGLVDYWKQYGWPDLCHPVSENDFECD